MTWLDDNKPTVVTAAIGALSALGAVVRILWDRLVERQSKRILELEAKLEASEQRHLKTALTLERLLGKLESGHARSSSRPPSS